MSGHVSGDEGEPPQIFTGIVFELDLTLPEHVRQDAREALMDRGAKPAASRMDANLIITDTLDLKEESHLATGTELATTVWLQHSLKHNKRMHPKYYSPDPSKFMSGVIATSNDDLPRNDVEALSGAMHAYGGQWKYAFTADVTHVFAMAPKGDVYDFAMSLKQRLSLDVVVPAWFQDCQTLQQLIPTGPYSFPSPMIYKPLAALTTPQGEDFTERLKVIAESAEKNSLYRTVLEACGEKESKSRHWKRSNIWGGKKVLLGTDLGVSEDVRKSVQDSIARNGGLIVLEPSLADVLICRFRAGSQFEEAVQSGITIGSFAWALYVEQVQRLTSPLDQLQHFPIPQYPIKGFQHHTITITNYTGDSREYMKQLISLTGAEFTANFSQKNTMVIAAHLTGTKVEKAITWGIPVVNHTWLEDCFLEWKPMSIGGSATAKKYSVFPSGLNFMHLLGERGFMGFSEIDPRRIGVEPVTVTLSQNNRNGSGAQSTSTNPQAARDPVVSPSRSHKFSNGRDDIEMQAGPSGSNDRTSRGGTSGLVATIGRVNAPRRPAADAMEAEAPQSQERRSGKHGHRRISNGKQREAVEEMDLYEPEQSTSRTTVMQMPSSRLADTDDDIDINIDTRAASPDLIASKAYNRPGSKSIRPIKSMPTPSRSPLQSSASRSVVDRPKHSASQETSSPLRDQDGDISLHPRTVSSKGKGTTSSSFIRKIATDGSSTTKSRTETRTDGSSPMKKSVWINLALQSLEDDEDEEEDEVPLPKRPTHRKAVARRPSDDPISEHEISDDTGSSDNQSEVKRTAGSKKSRLAQHAHSSKPGSSTAPPASVGRSRRGAATAAETKLRDQIMPDLLQYQKDMKAGRGDPKRLKMVSQAGSSPKKRGREEISSAAESDGDEHRAGQRRKPNGSSRKVTTVPTSSKKLIKGKGRAQEDEEDASSRSESEEEANEPTATAKAKRTKKVRMASPNRSSSGGQPSPGPVVSKTKQPKIMRSQLEPDLSEKHLRELKRLGAVIVEKDAAECTHLVMDGIKRSVKFLVALALGKYIVTPQWVQKSLETKRFIDESQFLVRDPTGEKKHNFNLQEAIKSVRSGKKVFKDHTFYVTANVRIDYSDLKRIIEANGGAAVKDITRGKTKLIHPSNRAAPTHHIVSCTEDRLSWATLHHVNGNLRIYTQEFILQSALTQRVDWDAHRVEASVIPAARGAMESPESV
ncbi:hypothetical protein FRB93_008256 [Tulasnella sp. JGI-2019a]|nr:hypothetical protein FRB93_008256 [Tulasnella sp. JGI-2019a]